MRNDASASVRLRKLIHEDARVIEPQSVTELIQTLEGIAAGTAMSKKVLYIVGGDGTFNQVLNWVMRQPEHARPCLMPIGGGQFNFMTRFVGLKQSDPTQNAARFRSRKMDFEMKQWRPIRIHDSLSGETRYAAVVGNGILTEFVSWYDESGKGNVLDVCKLIGTSVFDFVTHARRGTHGRLKPTYGEVSLNGTPIPSKTYAAFMCATVPEFMPTCRPLRKTATSSTFPAYVYWGNFKRLAASIPFIWVGSKSPMTDAESFNDLAHTMHVETQDPRILLDGDIHAWPTPAADSPDRTLTITLGEEIRLLHAVF